MSGIMTTPSPAPGARPVVGETSKGGAKPATSSSSQPWKWPGKRTIFERPVWARAIRHASPVASLPELTKRTRSAHGTRRWMDSAHST